MDDDWRLQIDLDDEGVGGAIADHLRSAELEQENRDLKKLIDEKFPDLRRQLKAVS